MLGLARYFFKWRSRTKDNSAGAEIVAASPSPSKDYSLTRRSKPKLHSPSRLTFGKIKDDTGPGMAHDWNIISGANSMTVEKKMKVVVKGNVSAKVKRKALWSSFPPADKSEKASVRSIRNVDALLKDNEFALWLIYHHYVRDKKDLPKMNHCLDPDKFVKPCKLRKIAQLFTPHNI